MTARHEKPSPHESSTDTLIEALGIVGNLFDSHGNVDSSLYASIVREAAQRLNDLECDLFQLRGGK